MKLWVKITLWTLFSAGVITLAIFVKEDINADLLRKPTINIKVEEEDAFLTSEELYSRLVTGGLIFEGQTREQLEAEKVETFVRSISQVKTAEVHEYINGDWEINVDIRKPVARIFNKHGETYYLDNEGIPFSITPSHTARIIVVTGNIPDKMNGPEVSEIINNDSLISIKKLDDIYRISNYVCNDPLFQSLLGQIHLEKNGDFVLIPLVGDQKIIFGSAYSEKEVKEKFEKLKVFYNEAMPFEGWNKYSEISLKYRDQIVCKKKKSDE